MSTPAPPRLGFSLGVVLLAVSVTTAIGDDQAAETVSSSAEVRGVDGTPMTLEAPEGGALAIVFLWTECPNSNQYSPALNAIAREFEGDRARLVGLFVDEDRADAEVAAHAEDYALGFPVGRSGAVELARALGVETVPSAVVVDDRGRVRYRGRIDDQFFDLGRRRQVVRSHDLRDALAAVLAGEPVQAPRTEAVGCTLPNFGGED